MDILLIVPCSILIILGVVLLATLVKVLRKL